MNFKLNGQNKSKSLLWCITIFIFLIKTPVSGQNVGIGTTDPDEKLTVAGTIKSSMVSSSESPQVQIHQESLGYGRINYSNLSSSQYFTLAGNPQRDSTMARFHIYNSDFGNIGTFTGHGRFGINASNPVAALHVDAQDDADLMRIQRNNSTKFRIFNNDAMVFGANWANPIADVIRFDTPNMFIGFDGNHVPVEMLEVDGTIRLKGFKMPYGQQNGYVLTSNSDGIGTWQPLQADADSDPVNELQQLSITGNELSLSNGNTVKLRKIADPSGGEVVDAYRYSTFPQIAMDINHTESFVFNRISGGSSLAFLNSLDNIDIKTDKLVNYITGTGNVSIGRNPNQAAITGSNNIILGEIYNDLEYEGSDNVFIGSQAGGFANKHHDNIFIGTGAGGWSEGNGNVVIGHQAGTRIGSSGIFIGKGAGPSIGYYDRGGAIGYNSILTSDDQYVIGNENTIEIGGYKPWSNLSDGRFKDNIKDNVPGLKFINRLRPITYDYNRKAIAKFLRGDKEYDLLEKDYKRALQNDDYPSSSGFIAQEVERTAKSLGYDFDGVVPPQNDHDP